MSTSTTYSDVVRYAVEQAEIWAHLPIERRAEQIDEHLASNFPDVPDAWIRQIVDDVLDDAS